MPKLLLADDSVTIQKVVELVLADEGYEIKAANNGEDALAALESFLPDVVLADIEMPKINGYQLCERIRQNPSTRNTPVILLAGAFEPLDEELAQNVGASDFLIKPFESEDLTSKIAEALKGAGGGGGAEAEPPPQQPAGASQTSVRQEPLMEQTQVDMSAPADEEAEALEAEEDLWGDGMEEATAMTPPQQQQPPASAVTGSTELEAEAPPAVAETEEEEAYEAVAEAEPMEVEAEQAEGEEEGEVWEAEVFEAVEVEGEEEGEVWEAEAVAEEAEEAFAPQEEPQPAPSPAPEEAAPPPPPPPPQPQQQQEPSAQQQEEAPRQTAAATAAPEPQSAAPGAVSFDACTVLQDPAFREELMNRLVAAMSEPLEKILWEMAPELSESLLEKAAQGAFSGVGDKIEHVIWETVPDLAEDLVKKEIDKINSSM